MQEIYYVKGDSGELDTSEDPRGTATIQSSFLDFAASLDYVISTSPFGTIRVPNAPYRADSRLAVAYSPTLQPKVAEKTVIWEGNLKKSHPRPLAVG